MITGSGLTIISWTNTRELPKTHAFQDTGLRVNFPDAADAMKKKYPWYQETVYYHQPTKALWLPIWEAQE